MLFGIYFVMQIYYMLVEIFIKISQIVQVSSGETRVGHFKRVKKKKKKILVRMLKYFVFKSDIFRIAFILVYRKYSAC